jgi:GH25 family lysozyme M1 (1,4-beta-N-acetylmuramidase)/peptidoglycan hydrolase CwlO-like protein
VQHRYPKTILKIPISVVMGFLLLCLSLSLVISPPARANDAVTTARAELAETMKALEKSKSQLVIVEKELATAREASSQINAKLKEAQAELAIVQGEMEVLTTNIAKDQAQLDEIASTLYKLGVSKEWLVVDIILSSDSKSNITTKLQSLNFVLDNASEVLVTLLEEKVELDLKVQTSIEIAQEVKVTSEKVKDLVVELAAKTQAAKDNVAQVQALANEKEAVIQRLVFAGLPTSGTILGADISYVQHPGNRDINFVQMYDAGIRFLYIKGSSGGEAPNAQAIRWSTVDFPKAREAGILTGIYHVALIASGSTVESAYAQGVTQANRAVSNMNALGGYKPGVLPIALDVEGFSLAGGASTPSAVVTAFTNGFVLTASAQTGRAPVIYSNLSFLATYLKDPALKNYPLWVANLTSGANPGSLTNGTCLITVWTSSNCKLNWTFWQYTHTAPAKNYGIYSGALDLNRLGVSSSALLTLANY